MKTLSLVFAAFDSLVFDIPASLHDRAPRLLEYGLQYQAKYNPYWQNHSLQSLSWILSTMAAEGQDETPAGHQAAKSLDALLRELGEAVQPGKDLAWFLTPIPTAVPLLARTLAAHPIFRNYTVRPVLLLQRQDFVLRQRVLRGWKTYSRDFLAKSCLDPQQFGFPDEVYAGFSEHFGTENCSVLEYDPAIPAPEALRSLLTRLAPLLGVAPKVFDDANPSPFPQSFQGLDMAYAVASFPFSVGEQPRHDRNAFYALLKDVEEREGYPQCTGLPQPQAERVLSAFAPHNAALASRLARPLFGAVPAPGTLGIMSADPPALETAQCRPFVAAMPEGLRWDLLRWFRDLDQTLAPEQRALAQALDDYHSRHAPASAFAWPRPTPRLCVLTMTRNHKDYITECMESVRAQKTDFAIEHIIVDDASDDGTQDIIDDYAARHAHVRPLYMPVRSSGGANIRRLFNACKSEYAALCDGDDYFTEPTKLQKQVEFLEQNPDCALCFHPVLALFEGNTHPPFVFPPQGMLPRGLRTKYYLADLLKANLIQTNSVVYRWRFRDGLPGWFRSDICPSDWYWHLLHAETGKLGFIPEIMSVYRRHAASYYAKSFISPVEHRREHGMAELETYKAVNEHFHGRYFRSLSTMANGVFADFLKIQAQDGDSSLLDAASTHYPDFALSFLKDLKKTAHPRNRARPGT